MPETPAEPVRYRVSYSERVRNELKKLLARAKERGLGPQVLAAVKEIDRRLHIYPQFGEPLRDLPLKPGKLWLGVVEPLVVQYSLFDDERRLVIVGVHRSGRCPRAGWSPSCAGRAIAALSPGRAAPEKSAK